MKKLTLHEYIVLQIEAIISNETKQAFVKKVGRLPKNEEELLNFWCDNFAEKFSKENPHE